MSKRTILLYGRTRSGKSTLIAELAEDLKRKTGKPSLVYTADKGGVGPMAPQIKAGIIDLVAQEDTNIWIFLNKMSNGHIRGTNNKWVPTDTSKYAMVANESITGIGDQLMNDMADKAANGISIGGSANINFNVSGDGETMKIGGSNMGHYNVAQTRILDELWRSQKLKPSDFVLWTAGASKEDDQNAGGKVIGPAGPGKALTAELPRHFDLCFRLDCAPARGKELESHTLYLGNSVDLAAGNAVALGNTRVPLGAKDLPTSITPASLVKAISLIEQAEKEADEALAKRMAK